MGPQKILVFIIIFCCGLFGNSESYAQTSQKDSIAAARKAQEKAKEIAAKQREKEQAEKQKALMASRDSMAKARAKETATRQAIQKRTADSIGKIRKRRTDSLAAIRKYRESKKYRDSVEKAKTVKLKALQATRMAKVDSAKAARKKVTDSAIAARKVKTDSARAVVKKRTDSLAAKRKYRESKRYADSVAVVKKMKTDSLMAKRKAFSDSLTARRKKVTDSFAKVRKAKTDSLAAGRKKKTDSLLAIKKVRTDSLAKLKEKKEKNQKAKEKEREQKQQLAFELKIKKKQKAYTNESMLKRRWGIPRQIVQNTFTHYNYYFNADRKMDEAVANMLRTKKDNYDSLLALFPFNPDRDSALLSSDMDSIIYKASMGIQIHDPRTKWGDDLYLLLGQAYFYKGNYKEASASFRYILSLRDKRKKKPNQSESLYTKKSGKGLSIAQEDKKGMLSFLQHRSVHNESLLWLSRTYTQMKQEGNAESVIDLLETDPNFPKDLQGRLALEKAFIYLNQKDYKAAATQLTIVADDNNMPNWMRMRSAFMAGQIQQSRGEYTASASSFKKVIDLNPKVDMDFYARKNLANSMMYAGGAQEESIASLKKVLNDGKYQSYYEQVYYVLGRLSANSGNSEEAIKYLTEGIHSSKSTAKQKGLSFATLGDVYYRKGEYEAAKNAYDSAAAFASALPGDSLIQVALKRSTALTSVTGPLKTIREQDSLLALGNLSEREMRAEVRRYIRQLQQQREDSIFKSEQVSTGGNSSGGNTGGGGTPYSNWYFNNTALVQQGVNEFKRKWGNRQPVDNWRRSAAASGMSNNNNTAQNSGNAGETEAIETDENGIPTEAALVALIPRTESSKAEAKALIRRAYMDAANAYIKDLEDYPPAVRLLDTFDRRYPQHEYKDEELYLFYLVNIRQNKVPDARRYADELLQKYPESKYAALVKPRESNVNNNPRDITESAFYEETYGMVLDHKYAWALDKVKQAKAIYPEGKYAKRFTIVEGLSLAGMREFKPADSLIKGFITAYPKDSLRPWADAILKYIELNKPSDSMLLGKIDTTKSTGASPMSGGPSATSAKPLPGAAGGFPPDVAPAAKPVSAPAFIYRPDAEHMVLFVFGGMDSRASGFRAGVTDFNTFKFNNLGLSTDIQVLSAESGVVAIKAFRNLSAAQIYMNSLKGTGQLFREYKPGEYKLLYISGFNYEKLTIDKDMKAYLQFYNANYK